MTEWLCKRVYEEPEADDGVRILIDRLWPRGVAKATAQVDHWWKDIAPTTELRQWFQHEDAKWEEFEQRYRKELERNRARVDECLAEVHEATRVTLLYATRAPRHHGLVLLEWFSAAQDGP